MGGLRGCGFVDLGNSGVLQPGEHLRFVLEAAQQRGGDAAATHNLKCHGAAGPILLCQVDVAHASLAQQAHDGVRTQAGQVAIGRIMYRRGLLVREAADGGDGFGLVE